MSETRDKAEARLREEGLRVLWAGSASDYENRDDRPQDWYDEDGFDPVVGGLIEALGDGGLSNLRLACFYEEGEMFKNNLDLAPHVFKQLAGEWSGSASQRLLEMLEVISLHHGAEWRLIVLPEGLEEDASVVPATPVLVRALVISADAIVSVVAQLEELIAKSNRPDPRYVGTTIHEYLADYPEWSEWRDGVFIDLVRTVWRNSRRVRDSPETRALLHEGLVHDELSHWFQPLTRGYSSAEAALELLTEMPGVHMYRDCGTDSLCRSPGYRVYVLDDSKAEAEHLAQRLLSVLRSALGTEDEE